MGDSSSSSSKKSMILENLMIDGDTPPEVLDEFVDSTIAEMKKGLTGEKSDLKMLPSYVYSFPTGKEKGVFYALDLGGTNFRVLRVQLDGEGHVDVEKKSWVIHDDQKTGTKEGLFGFVASGLSEFLEWEYVKYKIPRETKREIGFTFSFPIGKDVVACLKETMKEHNLDMFSVTALVNDSVGALVGAIYTNPDVKVAVILGTGTNACYIERMDAIPKIKREREDQLPLTGNTIINTEWGAFSQRECLPLTEFETGEDSQVFEKMISGKYLGLIVSKVLLEMAEKEDLFGEGYKTPTPAPDINDMQSNKSGEREAILNQTFNVETTMEARTTVVQVIDILVKRAARLAGAGIIAILKKMEQDEIERGTQGVTREKRTVVVAIDGSLYEHYEQYRVYLENLVTERLGTYVVIKQFPDASGVGAALLANTHSTVTG
ncbi:hypothetical protein MKW92_028715 [Papaver armeniacum]|nr:hypothetical protein MKW92_028715 [Papaver armeniacum]